MGGSTVLKLAEVTTVVPVSKQMTTSDPLVWIDCEMTGLDQSADALIEVAVVVTDYELKPLAEGIDVLIKPPAAALEQMDDYVRTMHTSSGLLAALEDGVTMETARSTVLDYVTSLVPEPRTAQLAGNSVGTDKAFLARDMPELIEHLHYRIVDVSSLKELAKRWYPRSPSTSCATTARSYSPPGRARALRSARTRLSGSSTRLPGERDDGVLGAPLERDVVHRLQFGVRG